MARHIEGNLLAEGLRLGIVVSRWNHFICDRLVEGALDAIRRHGGDDENVDIVFVPGAFELPMASKKLCQSGRYDAVIVIGVLIRGSTPHFDYIAAEATKGIAQASMDSGVPVSFGLITTDTIEQAIERAGTKAGNKGHEAAMAAVEMANLFKAL
jgi:6,7-dimethyl-8-ribityllumazine synthase